MKKRLLLAGCGGMARAWVEHILEHHKEAGFVALVDIIPEAAAAYREKYKLDCPAFGILEEAIAKTKPDVVLDVTIPGSHESVASAAMNNGCDVFSEKPMSDNYKACERLLAISEKTGRSYTLMQNRRYNKSIRAYRGLVGSGAIGKLGYLGADFFIGARFGGFRAEMDNPLVLDMAIHTFDQARFISGTDPVSVYCHEWNPPGSWYKGAANAVIIYEMRDGSVFCYRGSWCAQGANTSWECEWRAQGEKGTAIWDGADKVYADVVDDSKTREFIGPFKRIEANWDWAGREGHAGCIDDMFAALEKREPAMTDCKDNIHSMRMVFGAIESAKAGRKLLMSEL